MVVSTVSETYHAIMKVIPLLSASARKSNKVAGIGVAALAQVVISR
jgi:hypothetical protein